MTQWVRHRSSWRSPGANFALLYCALVRAPSAASALRDEELRLYLVLLVVGGAVLVAELWTEGFASGEAAIRHAVFQATSLMTTTGFSIFDFAGWPTLALMALVVLMFVGGCAGSTIGSIKVVRHLLVGEVAAPRAPADGASRASCPPIRLNRKVRRRADTECGDVLRPALRRLFRRRRRGLAVDARIPGRRSSAIDAIAASATTLGNVGPALGSAGPIGSFEAFSDVSTVTMTILMWVGTARGRSRSLVLLTRSYWRL